MARSVLAPTCSHDGSACHVHRSSLLAHIGDGAAELSQVIRPRPVVLRDPAISGARPDWSRSRTSSHDARGMMYPGGWVSLSSIHDFPPPLGAQPPTGPTIRHYQPPGGPALIESARPSTVLAKAACNPFTLLAPQMRCTCRTEPLGFYPAIFHSCRPF